MLGYIMTNKNWFSIAECMKLDIENIKVNRAELLSLEALDSTRNWRWLNFSNKLELYYLLSIILAIMNKVAMKTFRKSLYGCIIYLEMLLLGHMIIYSEIYEKLLNYYKAIVPFYTQFCKVRIWMYIHRYLHHKIFCLYVYLHT